MTLAHLNTKVFQIGDTRNLAHLNDGSLENYLKLFLLTCQVNNLSPRSVQDYSQKVGAFIAWCEREGIGQLQEITANHIRFFLLEALQRCKPVSVHGYYGNVNRFFNWLVEEEILEQSPMSRMHPPKVPRQLIKPLSVQDINTLLALCQNNFLGIRNRAIILTFLDTGLRLSELANIQLADMDLDRGIIKVMGKGAKERLVRIGKETQKAVLKYLLQRNDNLPCLWITEERRPMQWEGVQVMIRRLGKRAGVITRCSPHIFRHTFGTQAIKNGANVFEVQALLGHSTLTMTRKYAATIDSEEAIKHHRDFSPVDRLMK